MPSAAALDIISGKLTDIGALPHGDQLWYDPTFRQVDKGVLRIELKLPSRIDFERKQFVEDDVLRGAYRYQQGKHISIGKTVLAESEWFDNVSVSPTGDAAAWLARKQGQVWYHHAAEGKVRLAAKCWIRANPHTFIRARAGDLTPAPARILDGWRPFHTVPYPEPPRETPPRETDR